LQDAIRIFVLTVGAVKGLFCRYVNHLRIYHECLAGVHDNDTAW